MGEAAEPGCNEVDSAGTNVWTDSAGTAGTGTMDDDGPERAEGKVDITTLDKTNKTPILISC